MGLKRIIGGKRAKAHGSDFEEILRFSAEVEGYEIIRIPDGCRQLGPHRLMRVQSPFDFVFVKSQYEIVFVDAKSTDNNTFTYSAITQHQLQILSLLESKGVKAGYIIYFRTPNLVVWFSASKLNSINKGQSLKPQDGVQLGSRHSITLGFLFR